VDGCVVSSGVVRGDLVGYSTAPQLSISQKAVGALPEDGNVMPKHVGATIHNKLNENLHFFFTHIYSAVHSYIILHAEASVI
jgi:hypothetical protein